MAHSGAIQRECKITQAVWKINILQTIRIIAFFKFPTSTIDQYSQVFSNSGCCRQPYSLWKNVKICYKTYVTICYKTPLNYSKCKNESNFSISTYWDNNHFISSLWLLLDTTYMHSIPLSPVHISLYRFPFFILVPWVLKY